MQLLVIEKATMMHIVCSTPNITDTVFGNMALIVIEGSAFDEQRKKKKEIKD